MYQWRRLSPEQREQILAERKHKHNPWHSPPHQDLGETNYHLFAACYEHRAVIGLTFQRRLEFEEALVNLLSEHNCRLHAWCVLPNHYHALFHTADILAVTKSIHHLHGKTSFRWNGEENSRGRKVWFNLRERKMRSESHFWSTINYIHHQPVHHGYVNDWQQWPFGNSSDYLEIIGREEAQRIWR